MKKVNDILNSEGLEKISLNDLQLSYYGRKAVLFINSNLCLDNRQGPFQNPNNPTDGIVYTGIVPGTQNEVILELITDIPFEPSLERLRYYQTFNDHTIERHIKLKNNLTQRMLNNVQTGILLMKTVDPNKKENMFNDIYNGIQTAFFMRAPLYVKPDNLSEELYEKIVFGEKDDEGKIINPGLSQQMNKNVVRHFSYLERSITQGKGCDKILNYYDPKNNRIVKYKIKRSSNIIPFMGILQTHPELINYFIDEHYSKKSKKIPDVLKWLQEGYKTFPGLKNLVQEYYHINEKNDVKRINKSIIKGNFTFELRNKKIYSGFTKYNLPKQTIITKQGTLF
jgi:hypothetical protein